MQSWRTAQKLIRIIISCDGVVVFDFVFVSVCFIITCWNSRKRSKTKRRQETDTNSQPQRSKSQMQEGVRCCRNEGWCGEETDAVDQEIHGLLSGSNDFLWWESGQEVRLSCGVALEGSEIVCLFASLARHTSRLRVHRLALDSVSFIVDTTRA